MPIRIYTVTLRILRSRISKGSKDSCNTCGKQIQVGDSVVTKMGFKKGARPIRHEECARRVGILD